MVTVTLRDVLHQLRTAGWVRRRKQQMDVVCHQAVRVYLASKLSRIRPQDVEISSVIRFLKKAISPAMAPLHNVNSYVGDDQASRSRHVRETEEGMARLTSRET